MEKLTGKLQPYPWGSRTLIAELQGRPTPTSSPEAEVWFGAHPVGPAQLGGRGLDQVIAADPQTQLGTRVREEFGDDLPFLIKFLAAAQPLSLQAHPSLEQAREGFAREDAAGISRTAGNRNYKDANHKPELIVAVTEFEAMAGFRPLERTCELFQELSCPELDRYLTMLDHEPDHESDNLRALFTTWITIPVVARQELIEAVVRCSQAYLDAHPAQQEGDSQHDWIRETLENILHLADRYPGDVGVLGALLLNKVTLEPGEAIFLDAGQLHAYVKGLGVEIMANSDNVLRGGLTSKHVDVPELVRVLKFTTLADPRVSATRGAGDALVYPVPVPEFELTRYSLTAGEEATFTADGPMVALCTFGDFAQEEAEEADEEGAILSAGEGAWASAQEAAAGVKVVAGSDGAQVFVATAGQRRAQ